MALNIGERTGTRFRPTAGGGLIVVLSSIAVSLVALQFLGSQLRIHWSVGTHYQLGPEYAPTLAVLAAFPIIVTALFAGLSLLGRRLERVESFEDGRAYYELVAFGTMTAVVIFQVTLVGANLVV
ncbi:hypothetical protein [Natrarchaeobius chitinivorans]|uniref:DUF1648 domain-containing protein n=1 Tax=Natrarchaeobius chitinivorans TaxID=1679083 RepID=A0A3N6M2C7_NATCH|nr:hypothetical protein [Natrarchaeobius chitinivorans]RQG95937.1 hypothetical protein EA473_07075 [Natrarchaeobius chitinivorans]